MIQGSQHPLGHSTAAAGKTTMDRYTRIVQVLQSLVRQGTFSVRLDVYFHTVEYTDRRFMMIIFRNNFGFLFDYFENVLNSMAGYSRIVLSETNIFIA